MSTIRKNLQEIAEILLHIDGISISGIGIY